MPGGDHKLMHLSSYVQEIVKKSYQAECEDDVQVLYIKSKLNPQHCYFFRESMD